MLVEQIDVAHQPFPPLASSEDDLLEALVAVLAIAGEVEAELDPAGGAVGVQHAAGLLDLPDHPPAQDAPGPFAQQQRLAAAGFGPHPVDLPQAALVVRMHDATQRDRLLARPQVLPRRAPPQALLRLPAIGGRMRQVPVGGGGQAETVLAQRHQVFGRHKKIRDS